MPILPDTYLARLNAAAEAAGRAEDDFRKSYASQLQALERARVFANRRFNLVRELSRAIEGADDGPAAIKAGERILAENFSLSGSNPAHTEILAAFARVSDEIDTALNCEGEPQPDVVLQSFAEFEQWYEARTGTPFMALYDVYVPQTPVVDF